MLKPLTARDKVKIGLGSVVAIGVSVLITDSILSFLMVLGVSWLGVLAAWWVDSEPRSDG